MRLYDALTEYISWKRKLGGRFESGASRLRSFEKHIGNVQLNDLRKDQIQTFLDRPQISSITWRDRYFLLYRFFEYCYARGYGASIPMPENRPASIRTFIPYIYSRDELRRILEVIPRVQEGRIIAPATFKALLLFLYGTGATLSETLSLRRADVDFTNMQVKLLSRKFDGFRTIPIGKDLSRIMLAYFRQSRRRDLTDPFFSNEKGIAISRMTLKARFQTVRITAKVGAPGHTSGQPTLHCLRHTFAVHRVIDWLKQDADLNIMMPALSIYMGQVGLSSTARYLKLAPERFRQQLVQVSGDRKRPNWKKNRDLMRFLKSL